jgi:16S rRNA (cytosine1402-N4)-methyltransferase
VQDILHKSVLVKELIEYLAPQPGGLYVDATCGTGGHTQAILESQPDCKVIAIDWDKSVLESTSEKLINKFGDRVDFIWGNFAQIGLLLHKKNISCIDGICADFGTSQYQIFSKAGFSFSRDTVLDMRMSPAHYKTTAKDIINKASEKELVKILRDYGQDPLAYKIAQAIVTQRAKREIQTTRELCKVIESIVNVEKYRRARGIHPATQTFQALRIAVNHELENIEKFLASAHNIISFGGRIVCISFHSLEDRIVKRFFKDKENESSFKILTKKPVMASEQEMALNISSRSAKLRAAERML